MAVQIHGAPSSPDITSDALFRAGAQALRERSVCLSFPVLNELGIPLAHHACVTHFPKAADLQTDALGIEHIFDYYRPYRTTEKSAWSGRASASGSSAATSLLAMPITRYEIQHSIGAFFSEFQDAFSAQAEVPHTSIVEWYRELIALHSSLTAELNGKAFIPAKELDLYCVPHDNFPTLSLFERGYLCDQTGQYFELEQIAQAKGSIFEAARLLAPHELVNALIPSGHLDQYAAHLVAKTEVDRGLLTDLTLEQICPRHHIGPTSRLE